MKPKALAAVLPDSRDRFRQQQLAKQCFWDEVEQTLWIDARKIEPQVGVVSVIGWERMMFESEPIPAYPQDWRVFAWSNFSQLAYWRKQIPKWIQDSCALFPSHQLTLLHYCGKYPQILELLDHAPLLAWRLVTSGLEEPEVVALLSGKRVEMAAQVGWPGKEETVKFLRNLRLRWVNQEISEQIEVCLLDERRLHALQSLPRINSMALSLAARFPELIGCRLHRALAQLPCRPMQCQSMVALLEDAYRLADYLGLDEAEVARIGESRYLVEVSQLYQQWLNSAAESALQGDEEALPALSDTLAPSAHEFMVLTPPQQWLQLSLLQQHAWITELDGESDSKLIAWQQEDAVWAALIKQAANKTVEIVRVRGPENSLPSAKELANLHLWQAKGRLQALFEG
ncbi:hypothetical protein [Thiomicrorhabdus cannonii]|uniref:hypothetical protein n=1 Tax=Thiomicrorhabdus cannonii TaxID=2748011 RepID=UPI001FE8769E|nr:hypothetical protein [Thiomicrorhabdus cannonii]